MLQLRSYRILRNSLPKKEHAVTLKKEVKDLKSQIECLKRIEKGSGGQIWLG